MFKTRGGHYIIPVLKNTMMNPMLNSESPDHIEEGDEEAHLEQKDDSKSVEEEHDSDLGDDDAEAVMVALFAECSEDLEIWRLHEVLGHSNFVAMMLENDEENYLQKVH